MFRSTRLEVDLDGIAHNFRELRRFLAETGPTGLPPPRIACVIKADAYGLGARAVAGALLSAGAELLAVACLPEALELRAAWPKAEILVMGHTPSTWFPEALGAGLVLTLFDLGQAQSLSAAALAAKRPGRVQLKIDSGMNRLGLKPGPDTPTLLKSITSLPGLSIEGVFTHLALDSAESDRLQVKTFLSALEGQPGLAGAARHVCDSIGLARYPEYRFDLVRPGAILFGNPPLKAPLLAGYTFSTPYSWKTAISRLRRIGPGEGVGYDRTFVAGPEGALIATLPVGYADGYRRCLSNRAEVLVAGARAPVVGLICMDQLTVDVSRVPAALEGRLQEGDEVTLLGPASLAEPEGPSLGILELAEWAGTNRNEILASIGRRVGRAYLKGGNTIAEVDYLLGKEECHGA